jgi:hypothetical protein
VWFSASSPAIARFRSTISVGRMNAIHAGRDRASSRLHPLPARLIFSLPVPAPLRLVIPRFVHCVRYHHTTRCCASSPPNDGSKVGGFWMAKLHLRGDPQPWCFVGGRSDAGRPRWDALLFKGGASTRMARREDGSSAVRLHARGEGKESTRLYLYRHAHTTLANKRELNLLGCPGLSDLSSVEAIQSAARRRDRRDLRQRA